jgi:hypothetical protein
LGWIQPIFTLFVHRVVDPGAGIRGAHHAVLARAGVHAVTVGEIKERIAELVGDGGQRPDRIDVVLLMICPGVPRIWFLSDVETPLSSEERRYRAIIALTRGDPRASVAIQATG